jgi:hypothetical protein
MASVTTLGTGLDIAPLRRADILVTQNCLDYLVRDSELMQVRGEASAIRMPAFPPQTVCSEHRLDYAVGEVV